MPTEPTPPTGGEAMQDHAPPRGLPAEDLLDPDTADEDREPDAARGSDPAAGQQPPPASQPVVRWRLDDGTHLSVAAGTERPTGRRSP